jgi:hypothetical protein
LCFLVNYHKWDRERAKELIEKGVKEKGEGQEGGGGLYSGVLDKTKY